MMILQRLFCLTGLVLLVPLASTGTERPVLDVDLSASRVRPEGRAQFIGAEDSRHLRSDVQSPAAGAISPHDDTCLVGGDTWEPFALDGLICYRVGTLIVDPVNPSRLYAGTGGNGLFRFGPPPR